MHSICIYISSNEISERPLSSMILQINYDVNLSKNCSTHKQCAHFKCSQAKYFYQGYVKVDLMLFAVLPRTCICDWKV